MVHPICSFFHLKNKITHKDEAVKKTRNFSLNMSIPRLNLVLSSRESIIRQNKFRKVVFEVSSFVGNYEYVFFKGLLILIQGVPQNMTV